jgi:hypothetical protein
MRIADAAPRTRTVVTGTIFEVNTVSIGGARSCFVALGDQSGEIGLLFLGRPIVPGLVVGARCTVEGTVRLDGGRPVIWNPLYVLELPDASWPDLQEEVDR